MHNPKPPPTNKRPPAPPAPQNPDAVQELKHVSRLGIPETGGLPDVFIVKLNQLIPKSHFARLYEDLYEKINNLAPGSEIVILPDYVDAVEIQEKEKTCQWVPTQYHDADDAGQLYDTECGLQRMDVYFGSPKYCSNCGGRIEIRARQYAEEDDSWINERIGKKETVSFPLWLPLVEAPRDRYILIRDPFKDCTVVMWSPSQQQWLDSSDHFYDAVEWMELPK